MRLNSRMRSEISGCDFSKIIIPDSLWLILDGGFFLKDGCVFLNGLFSASASVAIGDFCDRTGFECFVNSLHIDDFVSENYICHAINFSRALLLAWKRNGGGEIRMIVSGDDLEAVCRFHMVRVGENWISDDLNSYEEAIMVIDSSRLDELEELLHLA